MTFAIKSNDDSCLSKRTLVAALVLYTLQVRDCCLGPLSNQAAAASPTLCHAGYLTKLLAETCCDAGRTVTCTCRVL